MYVYKSPIGAFWIKPHNNRFVLGIDNQAISSYHSAVAAADDVYMYVTGYYKWDSLDGEILDAPTDIYEWEED